jgi:hypothetical protein
MGAIALVTSTTIATLTTTPKIGTKIMMATQDLIDLANTDYDAFWAALTDYDRALTKVLTYESEYDAIAIIDNEVIEFCSDEKGVTCSRYLGPKADLVVYVNTELTNVSDPAELNEFRGELAYRIDPIPVQIGQTSSGGSAVEWLRSNPRIAQAWQATSNR